MCFMYIIKHNFVAKHGIISRFILLLTIFICLANVWVLVVLLL